MTPADDHKTAHHNLQTLIRYVHGELPTEQAGAIAAEAKCSRSLQLRLDLIRTLLCTDLEDLALREDQGAAVSETAPVSQCPEPLALAKYSAAELDLIDSAAIQHHLTMCESCRRTTLHLERIEEQLTQLENHARAAAATRGPRPPARGVLSERAREKLAQIRADIEAAAPVTERSTLLRLCGDVPYLPYSPTRGRGALGLGLAEASELSARIDVAREEIAAEERERREREKLPIEPVSLPGDVEHMTGRALLLRASQDRVRRAVAALELATASPNTTDCAGAWNDLGVARFTAGDVEGALEAISEAVDLDPIRLEILYNRGRLLSVIGLRHLAERDLQCFLSQVRELPSEAEWAREALDELEALFPPSPS